MRRGMWKELRSKLKIELVKGASPLLPIEKDLQKFESQFKFALPEAYRRFVLEIGPGTLAGFFVIAAPLYDHPKEGMQREVKAQRKSEVLAEVYEDDKEFVSRMIGFGSSIAGDIFAWDPSERQDGKTVEYSIYALPRDQDKAVWLTDAFESFIFDFCFGYKFNKALGVKDPAWRVKYNFRPTSKRTAKKEASKPKSSKPQVRTTKRRK